MKRQYRRITGQKSTAKYLRIHGEQAAYILAYTQCSNSQKELEELIKNTNYEQLRNPKKTATT